MRAWFCLLGVVAVVPGCSSDGFSCGDDSECTVQGVEGFCEHGGVCSFPDEECKSGRRYGQRSPAELAGVCVEADGSSTGLASTGSTSGSVADTGTTLVGSSGGTTGSGSSSESSSSSGKVLDVEPNIIFMTSQAVSMKADLVEQADLLCNVLAQDAGLPGEFVAWLSTTEVAAIDRLRGARGWVRPDGRPFADRAVDIVEGRIFYPPVLDELGAEVRTRQALTGTSAAGSAASTCGDWTSPEGGLVTIGEPGATFAAWTEDRTADCADEQGLGVYCFGVGASVEVDHESVQERRAFVTTSLSDGAAGLAGFDEACASEASAAGLTGSFLAMVATSTQSALSRFDVTGLRWVNMLGVPLADTAAALSVVTHLDAPPSFTAAGTPVSGSYWVGATLPSMVGDVTCADWTGANSGRIYGVEHTTGWFGGNPTNCAGMFHVVCFEE